MRFLLETKLDTSGGSRGDTQMLPPPVRLSQLSSQNVVLSSRALLEFFKLYALDYAQIWKFKLFLYHSNDFTFLGIHSNGKMLRSQ